MRVLYSIQATGNGHISRALEIIPILRRKVDLDVLISGTQGDLQLPFDVDYALSGFSYSFGQAGGIDYFNTFRSLDHKRLVREVRELPVQKYDLVINDFEPVSAWAARLKDVPSIALSHQSALLSKHVPRPSSIDIVHHLILSQYAPTTDSIGFHFQRYDTNIFTPVIRTSVRRVQPSNAGHYTVYLPAYHHYKVINLLSEFDDVKWEIFSKHANRESSYGQNIKVRPVSNSDFMKSITRCEGIICGAGFETPAEALFLQKKLLVIPMKGQFEQQYNAIALNRMGVPVIKNFRKAQRNKIKEWLNGTNTLKVNYPDITEDIIDLTLDRSKVNLIEV